MFQFAGTERNGDDKMTQKDFTLDTYKLFISTLNKFGYSFQTCEEFIDNSMPKVVILRHDIDIRKHKALKVAEIEKELGLKATYYFRIVKASFDPEVIRQIALMGHEIGYHYENLSMNQGNYEASIKDFANNLALFRKLYPVRTICMHGSSRSKYDNRHLWSKYNYKDYGIICEPYLDFDFNKILYLTDTAQSWDGGKIAIRDKVESKYNYSFNTTFDILNNIETLPNQIMITMHPDRWANNYIEWSIINILVRLHSIFKKNILQRYHASNSSSDS